MIRTLSLSLSLAWFASSQATGQTLFYQWLNQPCAENLNCDTGCSACNMPAESTNSLFGSSAILNGISVCPHPVSAADNAIHTTGWPIAADPMVFVGFNAMSMDVVQVDSIVIRHRRATDGPQRLRVIFSPDMANVPVVLGESDVLEEFSETVYTDLGCLTTSEVSPLTGMQLRFQGIQGGAGALQIDEVRVVSSPCASGQVGIDEQLMRTTASPNGMVVDVLGRAVPERPAPGLYLGARKRIHVVQ